MSDNIKVLRGKELTKEQLDTINEYRKKEFTSDTDIDPRPDNDDWEKIYFILIDDLSNKILAFARIHEIEVKVDNNPYYILGFATLVATEKSKGYGTKVIKKMIDYAKKHNKTAVGFCKPKLSDFYRSRGLEVMEKGGLRFIYKDNDGNVVPSRFGTNDVIYIEGPNNMMGKLLKKPDLIVEIPRKQW